MSLVKKKWNTSLRLVKIYRKMFYVSVLVTISLFQLFGDLKDIKQNQYIGTKLHLLILV